MNFLAFNIGLVIPTGVTVGVLGSVLAFYECNNASQESQQDSRNEPALSTRSESVDSFGALRYRFFVMKRIFIVIF